MDNVTDSDYSEEDLLDDKDDDESFEEEDLEDDEQALRPMPTYAEALADPWFQKLCNNFLHAAKSGLSQSPFCITKASADELFHWLYDNIYLGLHGYPHKTQMDKKNNSRLFQLK